MSTHRVFYFSHAPENVYAIIREEEPPGFELVTLCEDSDDERYAKIAGCEVVIVAAKPMPRAFVDAAPGLKLIHHQGVGYQDTVATEALKEKNIALALTPAGTTIGVAEHTVLLTLAAIALSMYGIVVFMERRLLRWQTLGTSNANTRLPDSME